MSHEGIFATDYGHIVVNNVSGYEQPIDDAKPMSDAEYWRLQAEYERVRNKLLVAALQRMIQICNDDCSDGYARVAVRGLARAALESLTRA